MLEGIEREILIRELKEVLREKIIKGEGKLSWLTKYIKNQRIEILSPKILLILKYCESERDFKRAIESLDRSLTNFGLEDLVILAKYCTREQLINVLKRIDEEIDFPLEIFALSNGIINEEELKKIIMENDLEFYFDVNRLIKILKIRINPKGMGYPFSNYVKEIFGFKMEENVAKNFFSLILKYKRELLEIRDYINQSEFLEVLRLLKEYEKGKEIKELMGIKGIKIRRPYDIFDLIKILKIKPEYRKDMQFLINMGYSNDGVLFEKEYKGKGIRTSITFLRGCITLQVSIMVDPREPKKTARILDDILKLLGIRDAYYFFAHVFTEVKLDNLDRDLIRKLDDYLSKISKNYEAEKHFTEYIKERIDNIFEKYF